MPVSVDVVNSAGESAGTLEVSDALLGQPVNEQAVRAALDGYLVHQRHGSANTRTRAETRGGGAKPWRQKGTGRARAGSNRSPLWQGGAVTFGPKPRAFRYRVNRKVRRRAILSVFSALQHEKRLIVIDRIELADRKTRHVLALRDRLGIAPGEKVLVLTEAVDLDLALAARNLGRRSECPTRVLPMNNLSIFELLDCDYLILPTGVVKALEEVYG